LNLLSICVEILLRPYQTFHDFRDWQFSYSTLCVPANVDAAKKFSMSLWHICYRMMSVVA